MRSRSDRGPVRRRRFPAALSTGRSARRARRRLTLEPLEPRVVLDGVPASAASLMITELNYFAYQETPYELSLGYDDKEAFEFVELKNVGTQRIDLVGVEFVPNPGGDVEYEFQATSRITELDPGEFVVVVSNEGAFETRYGSLDRVAGQWRTGTNLGDNGEVIVLRDRNGQPILSFEYKAGGGWPGRADGDGATLELISPDQVPSDQTQRTAWLEDDDHWRSSSRFGGTPGSESDPPIDSIVINEVLAHTDFPQSDTIELYNTTDQRINIGGWFLSDDAGDDNYAKFAIPPNTYIEAHGYLTFDESDFNPYGDWHPGADPSQVRSTDFGLSSYNGDHVWLLVGDGTNFTHFVDHVSFGASPNGESFGRWPNTTGDLYPMASFTPAAPNSGPRVGPVIVSEVMYHPTASAPRDDEAFEFIEIFNPFHEDLDLHNWRLRGESDYDFDPATMEPAPTIPAHSAAVVVPFDPDTDDADLSAFRVKYGIDESVQLIGGYRQWDPDEDPPGWDNLLSNRQGTIRLQDWDEPPEAQLPPGNIIEDEVQYDDNVAPWSAADGSGSSVHRLDAHLWGNDATSWTAAAASPGTVANFSPWAEDDFYSVAVNDVLVESFEGTLLNDNDPNGDDFTAVSGVLPLHGTLERFEADGSFTYRPHTDYHGWDSFTYTITDEWGLSDTATVRLAVNTRPDEVNDKYTVIRGGTLVVDDTDGTQGDPNNDSVLLNDTDPDGDSLTALLGLVDDWPDHGRLYFNDDGTFTYIHDGTDFVEDSFEYRAYDGFRESKRAKVTIQVVPPNQPPVAGDDAPTTDEDMPVVIDVLANDIDPDDDALSVELVTQADHGTVVNNGNTVGYTPELNFHGTDAFTYTVTDGNGGTDTATVTVTVDPVNDPPDAAADGATRDQEAEIVIDVLDNDSDVDGDTLTVAAVTQGDHGKVTNLGDAVSYRPEITFHGTDTFTYTVSDGQGGTDTATVTVEVTVPLIHVGDHDLLPNTPGQTIEIWVSGGHLVEGTNFYIQVADGGPEAADAGWIDPPGISGPHITDVDLVTGTIFAANHEAQYPPLSNEQFPQFYDTGIITAAGTVVAEGLLATVTIDTTDFFGGQWDLNLKETFFAPTDFSLMGAEFTAGRITITNHPPVVADPIGPVAVQEDAVDSTFDLAAVFSDVDVATSGDSLSFSVTSNNNASLVAASIAGSTLRLDYQPDRNGTATIVVRATDMAGSSAEDTITLTVHAANDAPTVTAPIGPVTVQEDAVDSTFDLSAVFGDVDIATNGDSLSFSVAGNSNESLVAASIVGGTLRLDYQPDRNGTATIVVRATDTGSEFAEDTITVTVHAANDAPTVTAPIGPVTVQEDAADSTFDLAAVFGDVDIATNADSLSFTVSSNNNPSLVAASIVGSTLRLDYQSEQNGTATIVVRATDTGSEFAEDTIAVTVHAANDAPTVTAPIGPVTVQEDATDSLFTLSAVFEDVDIVTNGDSLSFSVTSNSNESLVAASVLGSALRLSYQPDRNGTATIVVRATDTGNAFAEDTIALTVTPANDFPVAYDDQYDVDEDATLSVPAPGVLDNDIDVDGDSLSAVPVDLPSHGTLTLGADGSLTYVPEADFDGTDTFTYKASDGQAESDSAEVTITVHPISEILIARDNEFHVDEDLTLSVPAPGILENDDLGGGPVSVIQAAEPSHGTLTLGDDGSFSYTPDADFHGSDAFGYRISRDQEVSNLATVTIVVDPVNDVPVADNQGVMTDEDTPRDITLGADDGDPEVEQTLTFRIVADPGHGLLSDFDPTTGQVTYTPPADYSGPDSFLFAVTDDASAGGPAVSSPVATVTIDVRPVNDAPAANAQSLPAVEDTPLAITLAGDDGDPDVAQTLTFAIVTQPAHGGLSNLNPATGQVTYTPAANYHGPDSFTFAVTDDHTAGDPGGLSSAAATVDLNVAPVNDAPVAGDDQYDVSENDALTVVAPGVLDNDGDVDGDSLSAVLVDGPSHGTFALQPDGSFSYTPETDFHGSDGFTYRAADEQIQSNTATVTITVVPLNAPPIARDDRYVADENGTLMVEEGPGILSNDEDPDGDTMAVVLVDQPLHGALSFADRGAFIYKPQSGFNGVDSFTYRASDGQNESNTATVTITVAKQLGTLDFEALEPPSVGWYCLTATYDGILTTVLTTDDSGGQDARVTLYANEGADGLVELQSTDSRMDYAEAVEGQEYMLYVEGPGIVRLELANLVQVGPDGSQVTVHGSDGDDRFEFDAAPGRRVTINGLPYDFDDAVVESLGFDGGAGTDEAVLRGSEADETVELWPDAAGFADGRMELSASQVERITAYGGGGSDAVTLHDSAGDDMLVGTPIYGRLFGDGFDHEVWHFADLHASATAGHDVARFYDSAGDDAFEAEWNDCLLAGEGFQVRAEGFDAVHAYATAGGRDVATFGDSPGDDHFYGSPVEASLFGNGFYNRAKFFESVRARASGGGDFDEAELHDSTGNDTFVATPNYAALRGGGVNVQTELFDQATAHAGSGGIDVAMLFDSAGDDTFVATPTYGAVMGEGFENRAWFFGRVHAYATAGGFDVAKLYDSAGDDTFYANHEHGALYGQGYYNWAKFFEQVHAYATAAGRDVARLFGSTADDFFYADHEHGALYNGDFYNRAKFFEEVYADASEGGHDQAEMHGSGGDDVFEAAATYGALHGPGFYHRAEHFEAVRADGNGGANDQAVLYDSALDDLLEADQGWARLSHPQPASLCEVADFDYVKAIASSGNDKKDLAPALDFILELEGDWEDR